VYVPFCIHICLSFNAAMSLARHRHPSSIVSFRTVTISSCDEPPAAAPSSKLPPCLLQQRAPRPARRDQKPIPVLQPRPRAGVGSRCVAKFGCDRVSEGMRRVGRSWPHHRVVAIMVAAPQLAPALHLRRGLFEIAGVHLKPWYAGSGSRLGLRLGFGFRLGLESG
jgi:hypothetical protein